MNRCPNCQNIANPFRLLCTTRRFPYRCVHCRCRSVLRPSHRVGAAIATLVIAIFCALAVPRLGALGALASFIGLYVFVIGGIKWVFLQLQKTRQ